jgi:hypothetical protein
MATRAGAVLVLSRLIPRPLEGRTAEDSMAEDERSESKRTLEERRAKIWRLIEEATGRPHVVLDVVPAREPHWALAFADPLDAFVCPSDVQQVTLPRSGTTFSLTRIVDLPEDFDEILRSDPNTTYWVEESPQPETDDTVDWAAPETLVEAPLFLSTCFENPAVAAEAQDQRRADPEWMKWLFDDVFPRALLAAHATRWEPQPVRLGPEWLHATQWKQLEPGGPLVKRSERAKFEPIRLPRVQYLQWLRAEVYARAGQAILARGREIPFDDDLTPAEEAGVAWFSVEEADDQVALTDAERGLHDWILSGGSQQEYARHKNWKPKTLAFHRRNLLRKLAAS